VQFHPGLTADKLKTTLFKDLWGTPICDLFTSKDDSSFSGTCDADVIGKDATCSDNSFCDGLDSSKKSVTESAIAGQIAQVILGFVEGSSGLVQTHKSITKVGYATLCGTSNLQCRQVTVSAWSISPCRSPHDVCIRCRFGFCNV
jgi:hypothetical protein